METEGRRIVEGETEKRLVPRGRGKEKEQIAVAERQRKREEKRTAGVHRIGQCDATRPLLKGLGMKENDGVVVHVGRRERGELIVNRWREVLR